MRHRNTVTHSKLLLATIVASEQIVAFGSTGVDFSSETKKIAVVSNASPIDEGMYFNKTIELFARRYLFKKKNVEKHFMVFLAPNIWHISNISPSNIILNHQHLYIQ